MKTSLKRTTVLLSQVVLMLGLATALFGAPFKRIIEFQQPGGPTISLLGEGDEFYAVFETLEGYTVVFDDAIGGYCYAQLAAGGDALFSTGVRAELAAPAGLQAHLRISAEAVRALTAPKRAAWEADMEITQRWEARKAMMRAKESGTGPEMAPPGSETTGQKTGLTLLIDFSDDPATILQPEIQSFCNGDSYTGFGNNGSVKKYFQDNSNGKLIYTNVVTIYVRVPQLKTYYNDLTKDCGVQGRKLIVDAVAALKALPNYDTEILPTFQALSTDSQGRVLAFNVFYAGGNGGKWSYGLWPHSWVLASPIELSAGGKKVYFYQLSDISSKLDIGTFCHENGHMLCDFPDIYDYDYDSSGGAGFFCLMNTGSNVAGGQNPTQICAYLKRAAGWATTINLTSASNLTANVAASGPNFNVFYRYAKPGVSTEYYLIECRNKAGHDAALPGGGIAVWHIDELGDKDNQSLTPNSLHKNYEVTLVQADGKWDLQKNKNQGDANDLYYLGNTSAGYSNVLNDLSYPTTRWWDGSPSGLSLRNFSGASGSMTFRVGSSEPVPVITAHPESKTVLQGQQVSFTCTATGEDPLGYSWRKDEAPITGANSNTFTIGAAAVSDAGAYSARVTNIYGAAISSNAVLTVIPTVPLATALQNTSPENLLTWVVDSALPWYGQTNVSHDGVAAAQSFSRGDGQTWTLQTSITGPCTLKFWWKVSSQAGADKLTFHIGPNAVAKRSGEGDWKQEMYYLPSGTTQVKWAYAKDASGSAGQDCGWVDEVDVVPGATPPFMVSQPVDQTGLAGVPASFSGTASGTPPLSYQWLFAGGPKTGATSNLLTIASPTASDIGVYSLVVSSPHGSVTSNPAMLSIVPIATSGSGVFGQSTVPAGATNVIAVSAGAWHSLALTPDLRVMAWGNNSSGQCDVPGDLREVACIAAGGYHSVALKLDRNLRAWGANDYGQGSIPAGLSNCIAVAAGGSHNLALRLNGQVVAWGDNTWGQCTVPAGLSNVVAIAAGAMHSLALRDNGTVVAWGSNMDPQGSYAGQCNVPSKASNVVAIGAGGAHSVALRANGAVIAWGGNVDGQINVPSGLTARAIAAGASHTVAMKPDGSYTAWGANWQGQCNVTPWITNVLGIAAGDSHTLLLLGDRTATPRMLRMGKEPGLFWILGRALPGQPCALEYKNAADGSAWQSLSMSPGTGANQFFVDPSAVAPQRLYRLKQW